MVFLRRHFPKVSDGAVWVTGHRVALLLVLSATAGWILLGVVECFPTEWFLIANMAGTLTAVFVLLLVQHSQNRDMLALQVKIDELLRSSHTAGNHMIGAEKRELEELQSLKPRSQADAGTPPD